MFTFRGMESVVQCEVNIQKRGPDIGNMAYVP